MSDIVEKVITAIHDAKHQHHVATKGDVARAAIKATLEHLAEHASTTVLKASAGTATGDEVAWSRAKLKAMLSQALTEMEG